MHETAFSSFFHPCYLLVHVTPKLVLENFPATGHNIEIGELKTFGLGIAPWRLIKTIRKSNSILRQSPKPGANVRWYLMHCLKSASSR